MSLAAAAAYKTVAFDFAIDTLSAHFISGPKPDRPLQQRVQRLSDSGRFAHRVVSVEQDGRVMVHVTCSFVRSDALKGRSMVHDVSRATTETIDRITLDDLEPGRTRQGPFMKFQRLPLVYTGELPTRPQTEGFCVAEDDRFLGPESQKRSPRPQDITYTSVAQISPPISDNSRRIHALGILSLSDFHVLDCAPTAHKVPFGLPEINDTTRTPTYSSFSRHTSLNHRVQFHVHEGFRADGLTYIEVVTPWAGRRRAEMGSRMFSKDGKLIATCVQEAYYVFRDEKETSPSTKGGEKL
jgi:acyl-CoA thioesterase 8